MNEQLQAALNTWPVFAFIALVVAGCWWADDKNTIRRQQSEIDDLREELEYRHKRDRELARQRDDRKRAAGLHVVPQQRTGGES